MQAADPPVYALSVAAWLEASLAAPVWRASRIDPIQALGYE